MLIYNISEKPTSAFIYKGEVWKRDATAIFRDDVEQDEPLEKNEGQANKSAQIMNSD
jgi:hypothetical protein